MYLVVELYLMILVGPFLPWSSQMKISSHSTGFFSSRMERRSPLFHPCLSFAPFIKQVLCFLCGAQSVCHRVAGWFVFKNGRRTGHLTLASVNKVFQSTRNTKYLGRKMCTLVNRWKKKDSSNWKSLFYHKVSFEQLDFCQVKPLLICSKPFFAQ